MMNMMGSFGGGSGGGVRGMGVQQQSPNRQVEDLIPSVIAYLDNTYGSAESYIAGQRERMQGAQQGGMGGLNLTERLTNDAQRVGYDFASPQTINNNFNGGREVPSAVNARLPEFIRYEAPTQGGNASGEVPSAVNAPGLIEALLNAIMSSKEKPRPARP